VYLPLKNCFTEWSLSFLLAVFQCGHFLTSIKHCLS
jgi:hypothetical protein